MVFQPIYSKFVICQMVKPFNHAPRGYYNRCLYLVKYGHQHRLILYHSSSDIGRQDSHLHGH